MKSPAKDFASSTDSYIVHLMVLSPNYSQELWQVVSDSKRKDGLPSPLEKGKKYS